MNVSPKEKLTRFIFSKSHFSKKNQTVKYAALIPPVDSRDLSVFRISSISDSEVWRIGKEDVQGNRTLRARADLSVAQVDKIDLKVVPDTKAHILHANITPFPLDRITRQIIATKLADASKLKAMPEA